MVGNVLESLREDIGAAPAEHPERRWGLLEAVEQESRAGAERNGGMESLFAVQLEFISSEEEWFVYSEGKGSANGGAGPDQPGHLIRGRIRVVWMCVAVQIVDDF